MAALHNLLIFGGTFDPVHNGHIKTAMAVQDYFHFEKIVFLPCKIPVLKQNALASSAHRLAMLELALAEHPDYPFVIDKREIVRTTPSYTVTTLADVRHESGSSTTITLLMGADSFQTLPQWHQWQKILTLANILVIERAHYPAPVANPLMKSFGTNNKQQFMHQPHGMIYSFNAGLYDISSSAVRQQLVTHQKVDQLLPASVCDYITSHQLYFE